MHFEPQQVYHIYNRGNNKQPIFFNNDNYLYFLKKIRKELLPYCEIMAYCLMPNHFHLMVFVKEEGTTGRTTGPAATGQAATGQATTGQATPSGQTSIQPLTKAIGKLLSSYTRAINIQNDTTGVLFQKKTKAKLLTGQATTGLATPSGLTSSRGNHSPADYLSTCFFYIHQNPLKAKLVTKMEDWEFSSFRDYIGLRSGTLCNQALAYKFTGLNKETFYRDSYLVLNEQIIEKVF